MSRMNPGGGGDRIIVKPTNNVYTVLAAVGIVALIIAHIALWTVHTNLFDKGWLPGN